MTDEPSQVPDTDPTDTDPTNTDPVSTGSEATLRLVGVGFTRDGRDLLDGIDWQVQPGEDWVVLGLNGSGKTTLIRCLLGEYTHAGEISIDGGSPRRERTAVLGKIGFVPQLPPPLKMPAVLVSSPTANKPAACALMGPVLPLPVKAPPTPLKLACSVSFSAVSWRSSSTVSRDTRVRAR